MVYHQCEVLYIIKPQERYTLKREDMLASGEVIYTSLRAVIICQVCDLDKKNLVPKNEDFLVEIIGLEPMASTMSR